MAEVLFIYLFTVQLTMFSAPQITQYQIIRQENNKQTACGMKRSWCNLMYHPTIYQKGWGESCKCNNIQDNEHTRIQLGAFGVKETLWLTIIDNLTESYYILMLITSQFVTSTEVFWYAITNDRHVESAQLSTLLYLTG